MILCFRPFELASSHPCGLAPRRMNESALSRFPEVIRDEYELEELLTRPSPAFTPFIKTLSSPLLILGAGGKMGPTLAVLARRAVEAAGHPLEVVAVSRFGDSSGREWLETRGVKTLSCDLFDSQALARLPDAQNIIYLVGLKFGTARTPANTWATNILVPARVCERFPKARIAALSTGNVYPLTPVAKRGSVETDPLTPVGEYANAAVGRERIFEFCSSRYGTSIAQLRLCYAIDLRYGVLSDIARKVYTGEAIDLSTAFFNCIWQGDANDMILRALALTASPPSAWNLCRPEIFSVRTVANRLGELFGRAPKFSGEETDTALLVNSNRLCARLGRPPTGLDTMLGWTAHWIASGGRDLGKPTHFEVRDGQY